MKVRLNGQEYDVKGDGRLGALLIEIGANSERVAVMVNGRVVPKAEHEACRMKEGDVVEVLTFMGGG